MADTNFAALDTDQKKVWSRDVWHQAREKMFVSKFMGKGQNSMIQRITELTKTERGTEAVFTMVPDIADDGVTGDNTLTGNEAAMTAHQDKVQIDQLRQAVSNTGRMNDQATVINFREQARDQLSYWLADRCDQLAFLTLSGIAYSSTNDGAVRGGNLNSLTFASDVAVPSQDRHVRLTSAGLVEAGNTATMTAGNFDISYKGIVNLQAYAKVQYLRGIKGSGGSEVYHLFLDPLAMAKLKTDQDFIDNARHAGVRGGSNTLWAGGDSYEVDGIIVHEFRHVYTTTGTVTKWGAGTDVEGCRALLCGAQALAMVDLEAGLWDERDHFDYGNNYGIAYGKIFGFKKPQFINAKKATAPASLTDYGVIAVDLTL